LYNFYSLYLLGPGSIHPDIWGHVRQADIVVADLTGFNPNVVYELGVAAAWRPIRSVVMLRDKSDKQKAAFDLIPARQRLYDSRDRGWIDQLTSWLARDIWEGLSQAPFSEEPESSAKLPMDIDFSKGDDDPKLWSPGPGHRRLTANGLEFGSLYQFPYSWLSPAGQRLANVRVRARMRFSTMLDDSPCWIGIALRTQGYLANYQHLVWLAEDGRVMRTGPDKNPGSKDEHEIARLANFDPNTDDFKPFDVEMNQTTWSIEVGNMKRVDVPIADLPHVYGSGRVLLRTYRCRALIDNISIEEV
jgi:hypothetical protein